MIIGFLFKAAWFTSKFAIKHVVIPVAISVATAAVLGELADRMREANHPNGQVSPVIKPEP